MARKITQDAANAFIVGANFRRDNTSVVVDNVDGTVTMFLHGNQIAKKMVGVEVQVSNAGWFSNTTKERLNGIPGVSVCQRKGVWYLNGKEWDGSWTTV